MKVLVVVDMQKDREFDVEDYNDGVLNMNDL